MASKIAGLGEIEGAKRLVSLAQKWSQSAAAMLTHAQKESSMNETVEFAKAQLSSSTQEVHNAEAYLKEVEKRWEVVDVDDNDVPSTTGAGAEATNSSAETMANNEQGVDADEDDVVIIDDDSSDDAISNSAVATATAADGNNASPGGASVGGESNPESTTNVKNETPTSTSTGVSDDVPFHITVRGCGTPSINGIYTLSGFQDGAPKYAKPKAVGDCDSHYFIFRGNTTVTEMISRKNFQDQEVKKWFIIESSAEYCDSRDVCHYASRADDTSKLPPADKWRVCNGTVDVHDDDLYRGMGKRPAPDLIVDPSRAEDFVDGDGEKLDEIEVWDCGSELLNGTYVQRGYSDGVPAYYKTATDGIPSVKIHRSSRWAYNRYNDRVKACTWKVSVHEGWGEWIDYFRSAESTEMPPPISSWTRMSHYADGDSIRIKLSGTIGNHCSKRRRVI